MKEFKYEEIVDIVKNFKESYNNDKISFEKFRDIIVEDLKIINELYVNTLSFIKTDAISINGDLKFEYVIENHEIVGVKFLKNYSTMCYRFDWRGKVFDFDDKEINLKKSIIERYWIYEYMVFHNLFHNWIEIVYGEYTKNTNNENQNRKCLLSSERTHWLSNDSIPGDETIILMKLNIKGTEYNTVTNYAAGIFTNPNNNKGPYFLKLINGKNIRFKDTADFKNKVIEWAILS